MTETWDYIVVGAGSSGCVMAEQLSADGTNRVLTDEEVQARRAALQQRLLAMQSARSA